MGELYGIELDLNKVVIKKLNDYNCRGQQRTAFFFFLISNDSNSTHESCMCPY